MERKKAGDEGEEESSHVNEYARIFEERKNRALVQPQPA